MWTKFISLLKRDNLLTQALRESVEMLDTSWEMYQASVKSLRQSDSAEIDFDLEARDHMVDEGLEEVRRKVLTHLAVAGKGDLSAGLVLVSVVIDIEKIGDYTKRIYELARNHPERLHAGSLEGTVQQAEATVSKFFRQTLEAYRAHDTQAARELMKPGRSDLMASCDELEVAVTTGKGGDLSPADAATVALYVKYLQRIAACSWTILTSLVDPFHLIGREAE